MPYYARKRSRKGYRKGSARLSSYAIATRTGARAQSRQIYALTRKIRRIERQTRPEFKVFYVNGGAQTPSFTSGTGYVYSLTGTSPNIDGNFARYISATTYFSAVYGSIANTNNPICFRVVGVQTKSTRSDNVAPNDVFNGLTISNTTFNGAFSGDEAQNAFNGPLKEGLARTAKVLFDRKFYLSFQRPNISSKIKCRRLMNYYNSPGTQESMAKGSINVYVLCYAIGQTGYTFDANFKLVYTDS